MDYKKLISKRLSNLSGHSSDKSGALIGLLAGLAVGAALGVLFAPKSGKETRDDITDKALELGDNIKDSYASFKETINNTKESLMTFKDEVVEKVKGKANEVSEDYKAFRKAELDKAEEALDDPDYADSNS